MAVYKGGEVCPREVDLGNRAWKPAQACLGREHQESVLDREAWLRGGPNPFGPVDTLSHEKGYSWMRARVRLSKMGFLGLGSLFPCTKR